MYLFNHLECEVGFRVVPHVVLVYCRYPGNGNTAGWIVQQVVQRRVGYTTLQIRLNFLILLYIQLL